MRKQGKSFEGILGLFIIIFSLAFVAWTIKNTTVSTKAGKEFKAEFSNISGLQKGAAVKIKGVKVGTITDIELDPDSFNINATFSTDKDYKIPVDSKAVTSSDGLLGGKFLKIELGVETTFLNEKDVLKGVSSKSLEDAIGSIIFNSGE